MQEKYNEEFYIKDFSIENNGLPLGGMYKFEIFPINNNFDQKIYVRYNPYKKEFSDTYQNDNASKTMTLYAKERMSKLFNQREFTYDIKCTVRLNEYNKKIDTNNIEEIKQATKESGSIVYCSYFLFHKLNYEIEFDEIKKIFENNLDYFEGLENNTWYSIGFYEKNYNLEKLKKYFNATSYWKESDYNLTGYYEINKKISNIEEFRKFYINNRYEEGD